MNTGEAQAKLAIICLTRNGAKMGARLAEKMPGCHLYLPERLRGYMAREDGNYYFSEFAAAFGQIFKNYSGLICIMATGIVVRSLGPLMASKHTDPAVVVVDESGQFAISLLSGHRGGANALAATVAELLEGQAVITTATDVNARPAVDVMAAQIDAVIRPQHNVKLINRLLAEGETVHLYSPWPLHAEWSRGFAVHPWPIPETEALPVEKMRLPAVIVDWRCQSAQPGDNLIFLLPRNLHLGIGCRKGVDYEQLTLAVNTVLNSFYIEKSCILGMASLDIKAQEPALLKLAGDMQLPLKYYDRESLAALEGSFEGSEWVKQNVGVDGVCEPAARLAAKSGITLVPKQKIGPVTVSVAMEKSWWWDWDQAEQSI